MRCNSDCTRKAHAAIGAALSSTEPRLPPNHTGIGTTYNLMKSVYNNAAGYYSLVFAYGEMKHLLAKVRRSLQDQYAGRGIPPKLTECLNEMGAALNHGIAVGGEKEWLKGIAKSVPVPEWQHEQLKAELAQAKKEIKELTKENEELKNELHAQRAQN